MGLVSITYFYTPSIYVFKIAFFSCEFFKNKALCISLLLCKAGKL